MRIVKKIFRDFIFYLILLFFCLQSHYVLNFLLVLLNLL